MVPAVDSEDDPDLFDKVPVVVGLVAGLVDIVGSRVVVVVVIVGRSVIVG